MIAAELLGTFQVMARNSCRIWKFSRRSDMHKGTMKKSDARTFPPLTEGETPFLLPSTGFCPRDNYPKDEAWQKAAHRRGLHG